ncbi:MAG: helix-turn-helix domain-containing protein [Rhodospirillales bacterium]|nr:helix-turn-helix domain-containing protein [Rhodospirillales bacterium]MDH3921159.1 helix-turn-helix domain-containing protein [Rhodospirillales bacterium]
MSKADKTRIRRGGTNVFADLGLPDAENQFVKAQLVSRMMDVMKARKLTQTAVAEVIGVTQPDVSNLIRGRFRGYSIDRLMGFLVALDQDVEIVVKGKPDSRRDARLTVTAA